jgi:serine protease Do
VETGSGSGIIIGQNDSELLIVTNYHVIEDADSLTITFNDEATAKASVKGTDSDNDLAVVAVQLSDLEESTKNSIAIATMDTSDNCKVGQGVIAIGNALGYGQSITVGYISALNRAVSTSDGTTKNLLQTDAAINPGNSGGALVNMNGEIIGINSAKYSDTDVEGMGFAIPISAVYDIIDDLMNQKTKIEVSEDQRGYLGIQVTSVDSSSAQVYNMPQGAYVYSIIDGGAASNSELQARDIITKLNGTTITTREDLTEELKYYAIGDTVTLTVSRATGTEYETMEIEVTLTAQVKE